MGKVIFTSILAVGVFSSFSNATTQYADDRVLLSFTQLYPETPFTRIHAQLMQLLGAVTEGMSAQTQADVAEGVCALHTLVDMYMHYVLPSISTHESSLHNIDGLMSLERGIELLQKRVAAHFGAQNSEQLVVLFLLTRMHSIINEKVQAYRRAATYVALR